MGHFAHAVNLKVNTIYKSFNAIYYPVPNIYKETFH